MMTPAEIYLVTESYAPDDFGVLVPTSEERKIFARVTSVTSAEWFEGGRNGLNPEFRMLIFAPEYDGESILKYNGQYYTIYRTYNTGTGVLELYVEKRKGNADQVGPAPGDGE